MKCSRRAAKIEVRKYSLNQFRNGIVRNSKETVKWGNVKNKNRGNIQLYRSIELAHETVLHSC